MKYRLTAFLLSAAVCLASLALPMSASSQTWVIDHTVVSTEVNTGSACNAYTSQWQYWCQGASQYQRMRDYGCRVVAQAKLLAECGASSTDTAVFNPDIFLDWAVPLGYWYDDPDNMLERTKTGLPSVRYASEHGVTLTQGRCSLSGRNSEADVELVMSYIRSGHYVILSGPGHQAYVGRQASLDADMPIILDSWNTVSSHPSCCCAYQGYTISYFTELYFYSAGEVDDDPPAIVTRELVMREPVTDDTPVLSSAPVISDASAAAGTPAAAEAPALFTPSSALRSFEVPEPVFNPLENFRRCATYYGQFLDVAPDSWYYTGVSSAYELGLIKGISENLFDASRSMTLAEVLTIVCRLHRIYYAGASDFPSGTPWYQPYYDYALQNGIITPSFGDLTRPATRAEFAALFSNALPDDALAVINVVEDGAIPDVAVGDPYAPAIYRLYRAGIVIGSDLSGSFRPQSTVSRAEAATIVTRVADASLRCSILLTVQ